MLSSFVSNRSLYRDLLFLTLVALGKNNINISKLELSPETSRPPAGQRFYTHLFFPFPHTVKKIYKESLDQIDQPWLVHKLSNATLLT